MKVVKALFLACLLALFALQAKTEQIDLPSMDVLLMESSHVAIAVDSSSDDIMSIESGQIWFRGQMMPSPLTLTPPSPIQFLRVNQRPYRGTLDISLHNGLLRVVNHVTLEEYLYGVIGKEMPGTNPEALKAQAVASRTLAYNTYLKGKLIHSTVTNQVYGGVLGERLITNQAVDDTRGVVLTYRGQLISSPLFSSTCGGVTETSEDAFGRAVPYLVSVNDSDSDPEHAFCSRSPYFEWEYRYEKSELEEMLRNKGVHGDLQALIPAAVDRQGRVKTLLIKTSEGEWRLQNFAIRNAIKRPDGKILPSTWFTIDQQNDTFIFKGRGQGHGVGMCQWGAIGMADQGKDFKDILSHYYPGTELKQYLDR